LLSRQLRAARRLDRAAQMLTALAWIVFTLGVAASIIGAFVAVLTHQDLRVILVILVGGLISVLLTFLPMYFAPTWARAYAAGSMVSVQRDWATLV
ncbi:MAG TPA: hypothetical protein VGN48_18145, partial [Pedococcus sp.]|nr:hypothetical protein [Pedococcus sp.]